MTDLLQMLIRPHLGCGDMILCNAIFRAYAAAHAVFIPAKAHNCVSIRFMLRDLPNVTVLPVDGDLEADHICRVVASEGHSVLRLGMFGSPPYSPQTWDVDSFRQAHVPFEHRWSEWKCVREPEREISLCALLTENAEIPKPNHRAALLPKSERLPPYCFVHDDRARGFTIPEERLPMDLMRIYPDPTRTPNLFDWWGIIENATELHLIDSCFAILADSLPKLKARKKVIHLYARPGALPPSYQKDWTILTL